jgi:group I intron endonuclease
MQNAWKKYGEAAFAFEVLEECEPEFLVSSEQWWINMLRPEYNLSPTAGSSLGCRRTPETRAKIAAAGTGRPCSDETRAKRSVAMTGRTVSVEHRAKLSVALTGNKNGLGSKRTPESKAKMSEAQMGNTKTKGSKRTPETNAKQSASMKIVWAKRRAK